MYDVNKSSKKENTMIKPKEGDRCEITAISKGDAYYSFSKYLIGEIFLLKNLDVLFIRKMAL